MKKIVLFAMSALCSLMGEAQEKKDDFSGFLEEELNRFDGFVDEANKDFIHFMRNPWKEFKAEEPIEKRVKPEPIKPVVYDQESAPKNLEPVCLKIEEILDLSTSEGGSKPIAKIKEVDAITFEEPIVIVKKKKKPTVVVAKVRTENPVRVEKPVVVEKPAPSAPVVVPKLPVFTGGEGRQKLIYGGVNLYLSNGLNRKCRLNATDENAIANAYEALSRSAYKPLLEEISSVKAEMQLNDWAMYQLTKTVAEAYCGTHNECVVMQQFLLNEMGYKARIARKANDKSLVLYIATDCQLFGAIYIMLEGQKYYDLSNTQPYQFFMCSQDSPKSKGTIGMQLRSAPAFAGEKLTTTHQAKGSVAKTTVTVSKALMDFYKSYPQCDYSVYVNAKVSPEVEENLLASLATYIQGKSEAEAANILIDFVQTGFEYAYDNDQFGYEKPFFVEELFYYPYSDCEDRSVLFSYLVRKLLQLDVVLLDYPEHIATAVCFNEQVGGDYLMVKGKKYTVCDPTYIGATIGMTMPQFKQVAAKVLKY